MRLCSKIAFACLHTALLTLYHKLKYFEIDDKYKTDRPLEPSVTTYIDLPPEARYPFRQPVAIPYDGSW